MMSRVWASLALCYVLGFASTVHCYSVLTVITPGPQSHLFGMKRITEEMQSRGLTVTVGTLLYLSLSHSHHACMRMTSCYTVQYLATDKDAPRLTPTTIPTIIYHFDPTSVGAISQSGSMEVKGRQDLTKLLPQVNALFAKATDALFENSTAMAAVKVRTHPAC